MRAKSPVPLAASACLLLSIFFVRGDRVGNSGGHVGRRPTWHGFAADVHRSGSAGNSCARRVGMAVSALPLGSVSPPRPCVTAAMGGRRRALRRASALISSLPSIVVVGCMLNSCCVGRETRSWFALYLPNISGVWRWRVPSQLLESALAAALLLSVPILWNRVLPGAFFLLALGVYALSRLWLEGTRENIDRIGRYSLHRVISSLLAAFSVTGLVLLSIAIHAKS